MSQGLEQVKSAIAAALEQAGVDARTAYAPGWASRYRAPVVAVGLRTGESCGAALGSYLGQRLDQATQTYREIYGMKLELKLSLDIYSPADAGAAGCEQTLSLLHQVILSGLPSGLKPEEFHWEETAWDEDTGMFLRRGTLSCGAYFTAAATEDGALLTDFILKGVMTK